MTDRQPDELDTVEPAKKLERDSQELEKRDGPRILKMELDDPDHPLNFPFRRKCFQAAVVTLMTMSAAFSSSIFSGSAIVFADIYNLSFEVSILSVGLFTLGFAFGPPIWGPMSEVVGRNIPYWIAYGFFVACHFLVGFAPNAAAVLIGRFLEGLFGSVCLVLVTASISDMFEPKQRGYFTAAGVGVIFASPALGPIIGSFLTDNVGWRWTSWLLCIYAGILWILSFFMRETYVPVLLKRRAIRMRKEGHDVVAPLENDPITAKLIITKYLVRPSMRLSYRLKTINISVHMLFVEPALLFLSLYTAIGYSLLYSFLLAYSYVFAGIRGFSHTIATLPLCGVIVGVFMGCGAVVLLNPLYIKEFQRLGRPNPEKRMQVVMFGTFALPIGLFMFAWTAPFTSVHWIVPTIAGTFCGFGIITIFVASMLYCVDAFTIYAASAVAANAMSRALLATAFIMFSRPMFEAMTIQGAFSFLGALGILSIPGPFLIIRYGERLRKNSTYGQVY